MDEMLSGYANSATAYATAVNELSLLSRTRHTRSAYLAALEVVEKTRQVCELARMDFRTPQRPARRERFST